MEWSGRVTGKRGTRAFFALVVAVGLILNPLLGVAQYYNQGAGYLNANSQWTFGNNLGLNKTNNALFPVSGLNSSGATLSVADSVTGQLLFYSNGVMVWNAAGQMMPNGYNLGGENSGGRTQPVCAVPFINEPGKYYLFALADPFSSSGYAPNGKGKLYYSVLDMSLNSGIGDIVPGKKAILIDSLLGSSVIAIPGNHCDVWLVVHGLYESVFKAFHITANGLNRIPVRSVAGPAVYPNNIMLGNMIWRQGYVQGQMAVSPDRSRIAIGVINLNGIPWPQGVHPLGFVLSKFDADNGRVSDAIQFNKGDIQVYGIGFSPDNSKLYVNVVESNGAATIGVVQYTISNYDSTAISNSVTDIFPNASWGPKQKYMKLYKDTLYLSDQSLGWTPSLSRINQPNLAGMACDYQSSAIFLPGGGDLTQGITNDVVFALPPDTTARLTLDTLICQQMMPIALTATAGSLTYLWDNGSLGNQRLVTQRGLYWALSKDGCNVKLDTFRIGGADLKVDLGPDKNLCNTADFILQPILHPASGYQLLWQDGSNGAQYSGSQAGAYWVKASHSGCSQSDTVVVKIFNLQQDLGPDNVACSNVPVDLLLQANAPGQASVLWSDGSNGRELSITGQGTWWVRVTDGDCQDGDTIRVLREQCDCLVQLPNAFSPNNDGINDRYNAVLEPGCLVENFVLQIFNRWGQVVYSTFVPEQGWDGTFNGRPCEPGSYFYALRMLKGKDRKPFNGKGELLLLR